MNAFLDGLRGKVRRSIVHRGLGGTLLYVPQFFAHVLKSTLSLRQRRARAEEARVQLQFDRDHHVDTAGLIELSTLEIAGANQDQGHYYLGSSPTLFQRLMPQLPIHHPDFTFVDYGSGKGKAMLLASLWNFKAIVGVEFAKALHDTALDNFKTFQHPGQQCRNFTSVNMNATHFPLPPTPLVLFFYNPFSEAVMAAVLAQVEASWQANRRDLWICYTNPYAHAPLDLAAFLTLVAADKDFRLYRAAFRP
ncbi:MAG: hypothetical protein V4484_22145 [Pseudomonadota bacterium]